MRPPKMHWAGGAILKRGNSVPGYPCCCSGDRAEAIKRRDEQTYDRDKVTCKRCLEILDRPVNRQ